jgi:hypothetical protein
VMILEESVKRAIYFEQLRETANNQILTPSAAANHVNPMSYMNNLELYPTLATSAATSSTNPGTNTFSYQSSSAQSAQQVNVNLGTNQFQAMDLLKTKALYSNQLVFMIQRTVKNSILAHLPKKLSLDSKEVQKQMKEHSLLDSYNNNNPSNKQGSGGGGAVGGPPPGGANAAYRRRFGQRIILKFQSREYDSLFAFLLLEVYEFNKYLVAVIDSVKALQLWQDSDSWRKYVEDFLLNHPLSQFNHPISHLKGKGRENNPFSLAFTTVEDQVNFYYTDLCLKLLANEVPLIWLHYFDGIFQSVEHLKLDQWLSLLSEQRHMLNEWLITGKPGNIQLYLLYNPKGLFFALKESFAYKNDTIVDRTHLHFRIISAVTYSQQQQLLQQQAQQTASNALQSGGRRQSSRMASQQNNDLTNNGANKLLESMDNSYIATSLGCYCHLTNVHLINGLFSGRNNMLEFLPYHHITTFGSVSSILFSLCDSPVSIDCPHFVSFFSSSQEVVILVYTSFEEQIGHEEAYHCPFYIPNNSILPSHTLSKALPASRNGFVDALVEIPSSFEHSNSAATSQSSFERVGFREDARSEKEPIFQVPINTTEDIEDCKANRISLISAPIWMIPH